MHVVVISESFAGLYPWKQFGGTFQLWAKSFVRFFSNGGGENRFFNKVDFTHSYAPSVLTHFVLGSGQRLFDSMHSSISRIKENQKVCNRKLSYLFLKRFILFFKRKKA